MRAWNNESTQVMKVLTGHTDLCTSGIWLNENTIVSGSWDSLARRAFFAF